MTARGIDGNRRRVAVVVVVVMLSVGAAWLFWDAAARRSAARAGEEAAQAAREAIVAISSYQPATVKAGLQAAAAERLTGAFLDEYTQLITTVVVPEAVGREISATATVPAAAVVSAGENHAVVLAYVDQTRTVGRQPPEQTTDAVRVTMDKVDGRWLISGFEPI